MIEGHMLNTIQHLTTSRNQVETPGETVEKLLNGAPSVASYSNPASEKLALIFDNRQECKLRDMHETARPCGYCYYVYTLRG